MTGVGPPRVRVRPYGDDAVLLEPADPALVPAWAAALQDLPGVVDVVPAERTVLVVGGPGAARRLSELARTVQPAPVEMGEGPLVRLPVVYDGPDLAAVAESIGLDVQEVVRRHTGSSFVVAFCGFAPGFAYLTGLDPALHVPRRDSPRPRVPAGSVAIADRYCAVYPRASPGGWQLIGRTTQVLFDVDREPSALLAPATRVRFVARRG